MSETNEYYRDKVAAITGGASGIGLALAETMLSYGAKRVVLADVNEANLVRETARLNAAHPGQALGIRCDVTNEEEVKEMIRQAAEFGGGRIDLLFNNAGAGFGGQFRRADQRRLGESVRAELLRGRVRHPRRPAGHAGAGRRAHCQHHIRHRVLPRWPTRRCTPPPRPP